MRSRYFFHSFFAFSLVIVTITISFLVLIPGSDALIDKFVAPSSSSSTDSSSSGSNINDAIISADDISNRHSVWDQYDICSSGVIANGCYYDVDCRRCLERTECAIESFTGKCVSTKRIREKIHNDYFKSSDNTSYCASDSEACRKCAETESTGPCIGKDGCVCLYKCESAPKNPPQCMISNAGFKAFAYIILALCIISPVLIYIRAKCRGPMQRQQQSMGFLPSLQQRVRRHHDPTNDQNLLKLESWRKHIAENEDLYKDFGHIELKGCFFESRRDVKGEEEYSDSEIGSHVDDDATRELDLSPFDDEFVKIEPNQKRPTCSFIMDNEEEEETKRNEDDIRNQSPTCAFVMSEEIHHATRTY